MRLLAFISIAMFLASCSSKDKDPGYFDMPGFLKTTSMELGAEELDVSKKATLDGKETSIDLFLYEASWLDDYTESRWGINMAQPRWYGQIKVLEEANPNLPKYRDKFEIEEGTIEKGGELLSFTHYVAKNKSLDIKELYMEELDGEVRFLKAEIAHDNVLASNHRSYEFVTNESLKISGEQNIIFLKPSSYDIQIDFQ